MKLIIAAIMLAALSACGQNDKADGPTAAEKEQMFIDVVRDNAPAHVFFDDRDLIELAKAYCGALDDGITFDQLTELTLQANVDPTLAGSVIGAGVSTYCPEHRSKVL